MIITRRGHRKGICGYKEHRASERPPHEYAMVDLHTIHAASPKMRFLAILNTFFLLVSPDGAMVIELGLDNDDEGGGDDIPRIEGVLHSPWR